MGVLFEREKRLQQLLFGNVDTEAVEPSDLRRRLVRHGENDGFVAMAEKESAIFKHYVHSHEIMEILFGIVCLKFGKRPEGVNLHDRYDVLQQVF